MRTTEIIDINGRYEIIAVKINGEIIKYIKRLIKSW